MARIKRSLNAKKKRRRTLKMAKGYFGARSRCYRKAKEQVRHSLMYQYRDRRTKKREIRKLWIARINAGCRINGISYSQLAIEDAASFADLCTIAKNAVAEARAALAQNA